MKKVKMKSSLNKKLDAEIANLDTQLKKATKCLTNPQIFQASKPNSPFNDAYFKNSCNHKNMISAQENRGARIGFGGLLLEIYLS